LSSAIAIARKEWREIVRDRRSLYSGLFFGVWGPLVMGIALLATARHQGELGAIEIGGQGTSRAPALAAFLAAREVSIVEIAGDPAAAIRDRRMPALLIVDDGYAERFAQSRPATVAVLLDSSWTESTRHAAHLKSLLADYARAVGDMRLVVRGIAPSAIAPVRVIERDFATAADRSGRALATMPIFILLAAFIGGMSVAADVSAGERERGSLESLLLHPVSRASIITGKWLAISAAAVATVVLALVTSYAVMQHPRLQQLDLPIGLGVTDALLMLAALTPLALAASAVQLLIAFQARTYKEAQTKLSMMIFLPMIPGFLFAFGSIAPSAWMGFAPMIGQHMLLTDVVRGEVLPSSRVIVLTVLTLIAAAIACWAAARQLDREAVLRRAGA
jgi:sodium transport system permease protein